MGSTYVNDFPNAGRMQQVIIQADAPSRMQLDNVLKLYVRNVNGGMVPLSEVVRPAWSETPLQLVRFQGYPSARLSGGAAPATPAVRPWPKWNAWRRNCRPASRWNGPANRCKNASPPPRRPC